MNAEAWHIAPIPNTDAIVTIKDENGLEVATCIADDAPLIAAAPALAAALIELRDGAHSNRVKAIATEALAKVGVR